MPTTTSCQYCGSVGFVRKENVIKADAAYVHYYCGHCNSSWTANEGATRPDERERHPVGKTPDPS
jgi:transposase-like protein